MLPRSLGLPQGRRGLGLFCVGVFSVVVAITWRRILHDCGGHFSYALDDPYIHLALAERIRQGTYGINPGHPASPSSSILWPFLLVPFTTFRWYAYAPLLLNLLFGAASAWLVGDTVEQVADQAGRKGIGVALTAVLMVFSMNVTGLPFLGLEHSLQVLLCIGVARAACLSLLDRRIRSAWIVAAAISPMVRYECLLVVLALALLLWAQERYPAAVLLGTASVAGPIAFSAYLHHLGLPLLPASVLVKARMYGMEQHHGLWWKLTHAPESFVLAALVLIDVALLTVEAAHARSAGRKQTIAILAGCVVVGSVHLLRGPLGWFFRYEDYAVAYLLLITAALLLLRKAVPVAALTVCALGSAVVYSGATTIAPRAAREVYLQQYQMHRFVTGFYHGNVAVNDLGWVSFRLPPNQYVLDLFGLGSMEAQEHPYREPAWLDSVTRRDDVGLVMIYPHWFQKGLPDDWTPVARLCLQGPVVILGARVVTFYRTPQGDAKAIGTALRSFAPTLPQGARLETGPSFSAVCQE